MMPQHLILISVIALSACAPSIVRPQQGVYVSTPNAAATLAAANGDALEVQAAVWTREAAVFQTREAAAMSATRQAAAATSRAEQATGTAVSIATGTAQAQASQATEASQQIAVRITENAINEQATLFSIGASGTATAVAQVAQAERQLIDDESTRLSLQRERERATIQYQQTMNMVRPYLWVGALVVGLVIASGFAYALYQRSRPITVNDATGARILIPTNRYQVLPAARRSRLALPAPQETAVSPIPLPPLTQGHVLIAGETGSCKTTAMLAVLRRRQNVIVLDPHDNRATWGNARVIGAGRNFEAIGEFMSNMEILLSERYSQRAQGQNRFDLLTVATDEMPAIVAALGRGVDKSWRTWLREGRKVGLFLIVSTQSTRVKTLGIKGEGDLLENFAYVLTLGSVAVKGYPDLVKGMERPAVIRTLAGAKPVIIPRLQEGAMVNERPVTPLFVAPEPVEFADPKNMTDQTSALIRRLSKELPSQRAIESRVFGYEGGAAYQAVRSVLREEEGEGVRF